MHIIYAPRVYTATPTPTHVAARMWGSSTINKKAHAATMHESVNKTQGKSTCGQEDEPDKQTQQAPAATNKVDDGLIPS